MPQALSDWWQATPGGTLFFGAAAIVTFAFAVYFAVMVLLKLRALPRMVRASGKVVYLETNTTYNNSGGQRSYINVKVAFRVNGRDYHCRRLYLFRGNIRVGRPDPPPAAPPGRELLVYYDPKRPTISAMLLDKPLYTSPLITAGLAAFFAWAALDQMNYWA